MKLFHYTALLHLPSILREGLTKGEIPVSRFENHNGPNLTGSANPVLQRWSVGGALNKTKVRITVDLPDNDPNLKQWKSLVKDRELAKELDMKTGQSKFWYVYYGTISPDHFQGIEIKEGYEYRKIDGPELADLIQRIDQEREEKIVLVEEDHPLVPGAKFTSMAWKNGHTESWLLDGQE